MKRILFVDDDERVLNGLRRQLRSRHRDWEMIFAPGGAEALMELGAQKLDAVVTDMRMPIIDGAQVLAHVANDIPRAARLVLSGEAADDRKRLASSCAHRYLHKPCSIEVLEMEVTTALAMRDVLDALGDPRCEAIWARPPGFRDECEPVLQALMLDVVSVTHDIVSMLRDDTELHERIMQAAIALHPDALNSDSPPRTAAQVVGATGFIGAIMASRFLENFGNGDASTWPRAVELAVAAGRIAREESLDAEVVADAFVAGLLFPLVEGGEQPERLDLLAYLLPTWGFRAGVVSALTDAPRALGDTAQEAPGEPDAGSAILAARLAAGDPRSAELAESLRRVGWTLRASQGA